MSFPLGQFGIVGGPGERPVPIEFHLIVLLDDRLITVGQEDCLASCVCKTDLKATGTTAVVAVPHPDMVNGRGRNLQGGGCHGPVVIGSAGDGHEAALAALGPGRRPTRPGDAPVTVRCPLRGWSLGPAITLDTLKVFRLDPNALLSEKRGKAAGQAHKDSEHAGHRLSFLSRQRGRGGFNVM